MPHASLIDSNRKAMKSMTISYNSTTYPYDSNTTATPCFLSNNSVKDLTKEPTMTL